LIISVILTSNKTHGVPCNNRSNISRGLINVPLISILIFSARCGSGKKGARPKNRLRTIKCGKGIEFINFKIKSS